MKFVRVGDFPQEFQGHLLHVEHCNEGFTGCLGHQIKLQRVHQNEDVHEISGASAAGAVQILRGVDLSQANLTGADLLRANLSGAIWTDGTTICAEGSIGRCHPTGQPAPANDDKVSG